MNSTISFLSAPLLLMLMQNTGPEQLKGEELEAVRQVLTHMSKRLKGIKHLRARYEQRQHSMLLEKPLVSHGRMHLRSKPGCLVLELEQPRRVIVRSDETSHQIYYPEKKRAERYLFESNELTKALLSIFTAKIAAIEDAFVPVSIAVGEEDSILGFRPRDKRVRLSLDRLRLTVRNKDAVLVGVSYSNADGEEVVINLSKVELDPKDQKGSKVFDRPLPEDVTVVVSEAD